MYQLSYPLWENLQTLNIGLFTLCSCLKTKESYDRWVTRRVWRFRHQISKAKYLKMSVANIGKRQENTTAVRARGLRNFAAKGHHFRSHAKSAFSLEWLASNGCNSFISTPNRALFEALDCWLPESKQHIACINWTPGSAPKVVDSCCPLECFMVDFSLLPLLAFMICLWQRTIKLQSFGSSCY